MKLSLVLPLAALSTAIIIPDERVMNQIAIEPHAVVNSILDKLPSKEQVADTIGNTLSSVLETTKNAFDDALEKSADIIRTASESLEEEYFDTNAWLSSAYTELVEGPHEPPHHPPPHGKPPHGKPPHKGPHRGPPHNGTHHGPHKSNLTVYQLIAESKYTTKLAELIGRYDDLVQLLNGTEANYTIFAPTDKAFAKIPEHHHKPSKEFLKEILTYHVVSDIYPAGRVFFSHTIPTLLESSQLGGNPQRLSIRLGLGGLRVNFYSKVVAVNIFGSNGVIHGVDSILLPPPSAARIIDLLPGEFSTLELGLIKTGLYSKINDSSTHEGGTFFAPSNWAFKKLGPKINGFLFSPYGEKYLKALLKYHIVANQTVYSDAYYAAKDTEKSDRPGNFHFDLPTALENRYISLDIARFGRFITMKINGFNTVAIQDGIAKDGVIHVVSSVIIPPKTGSTGLQQWEGEELEVEDLKARLEPFTPQDEGMVEL